MWEISLNKELDENTPVCTIEDMPFTVSGQDAQKVTDIVNNYLKDFAKPKKSDAADNLIQGNTKCLMCDAILGGVLGSFRWGIAHGEGICSNCGYPCRAYHRPQLDGEDMFDRAIPIILQYHPKHISKKEK